jgi:hypothetical protein
VIGKDNFRQKNLQQIKTNLTSGASPFRKTNKQTKKMKMKQTILIVPQQQNPNPLFA